MRLTIPSLLIAVLLLSAHKNPDTLSKRLDNFIQTELETLEAFYKDLHQSPEISLFEKETSAKLANELKSMGFEVTQNYGGYGVVGIFKNGDGPTILYRTDMDALPMAEKTELPYASTVKTVNPSDGNEVGVMHSCGHDMHMTVWRGTAQAMIEMKDQWSGTLMMIGQPAEEIGAGSALMLENGLYEDFGVPDYGVGLHCNPTIPAGKVGFGKEYTMANVESVDITVKGYGAHGASPHMSIDPVVTASMIVMELQTIVSRSLNPIDAAVITVGSFQGGTKHNIIPDEVKLQLTIRTYTDEVRMKIKQRINEICKGVAIAAGLPEELYPDVEYFENFTPSNYNDPELVDKLIQSSSASIGKENVVDAAPQMVGEDFSRFGRTEHNVPTVLFWLGTVPEERIEKAKKGYKLPGLHSPFYYPDPKPSIETGVKVTTQALIDLMNQHTTN